MNRTQKIYYTQPYVNNFEAKVLDCLECDGGYFVTLDKTAFFPEEAGQCADSGTVNGVEVLYVKERDGVIYHKLPSPLKVGDTVLCKVEFEGRFERMQCHTAEHILSGIIKAEYDIDNVGFHLGEYEVTLDTSAPLDANNLGRIEAMANDVVFRNVAVTAEVFDSGELRERSYRSKLALTGEVRLVTVEGVDVCACCAPHVARTGEIGLIKILRYESHKGGTRIYMLAGKRAYDYITKLYKTAMNISSMLSFPIIEIDEGCRRLLEENQSLGARLRESERARILSEAERALPTDGNLVYLVDSGDMTLVRECANLLKKKTRGLVVCLSEREGGYSFVMLGDTDVSDECKKATAALLGRGGGRGSMAQGSFLCDLETVRSYFSY